LIAFNTLIGLILSDYATLNFLLADISLALSVVVIYFVAHAKMAIGLKIGLTVLFFVTGITRCLCIALAPGILANNVLFIVAVGILFFEIICSSVGVMLVKKHGNDNEARQSP
jgi:hypothetical protein